MTTTASDDSARATRRRTTDTRRATTRQERRLSDSDDSGKSDDSGSDDSGSDDSVTATHSGSDDSGSDDSGSDHSGSDDSGSDHSAATTRAATTDAPLDVPSRAIIPRIESRAAALACSELHCASYTRRGGPLHTYVARVGTRASRPPSGILVSMLISVEVDPPTRSDRRISRIVGGIGATVVGCLIVASLVHTGETPTPTLQRPHRRSTRLWRR